VPLLLCVLLLILIALPADQWRRPAPEPVYTASGERVPAANLARMEEVRRTIAARGQRWQAGVTEVAHLTAEQFELMLGALPPEGETPPPALLEAAPSPPGRSAGLPTRWDWRDEGGTTPARHQGSCGSCWAFAAGGALEGTLLAYEGLELDLSEQHVLDCNAENYGCSGGWMTAAYRLWRDRGAFLESQIAYAGDDARPCNESGFTPSASVTAWSPVAYSREALQRQVLVRPIAVAMHVYPDFQFYQGGVYEHAGSDPVNHAVLLVGWDDDLSAWIIKNSWGAGWGEQGFAWVRYDCCRLGSYAHAVTAPVARTLRLHHDPMTDTLAAGPYPLLLRATSLLGRLGVAQAVLHLDLGAGFDPLPLERLSGDAHAGLFSGELPATEIGARVRYFLSVTDAQGETATLPAEGEEAPFAYRVLRRVYAEDFAAPGGWQTGIAGDTATAGWWEWGVPQAAYGTSGLLAQPGSAHTPGGSCYVTGLSAPGNDVDGGVTTLQSPRIDLRGLEDATLRGWYWFTNHTGSWPWEDRFAVLGSADDGAHWVTLLTVEYGASAWRAFSVPLHEHLPLTESMRLRFVAADTLHDSTVEALIDDLEILTGTRGETSVDGGPAPPPPGWEGGFALGLGPNPARETAWLSFTLPAPAPVEALVLDASGRLVRRLWSGDLPAGPHQLDWDGRDDAGAPARSGRYWARVATPAAAAARPILLLR